VAATAGESIEAAIEPPMATEAPSIERREIPMSDM
jgi:hypothetical protein